MSKARANRDPQIENTTWLLERLGHLLRAEARQSAQGQGLKLVQLEALYYLYRANRYSVTTLAVAEALALTKGTTSQTLRALVDKGFVERRADADDGRVVHHDITAKGRGAVTQVYPSLALQDLYSEQEPKDVTHLNSLLTELLRSLQIRQERVAFGVCAGCSHFTKVGEGTVCGLTGETLSKRDALKICREYVGEPE